MRVGPFRQEGRQEGHLYAKGLVLPSAKKRREYLQVARDVGKKVSVSIYSKFDG